MRKQSTAAYTTAATPASDRANGSSASTMSLQKGSDNTLKQEKQRKAVTHHTGPRKLNWELNTSSLEFE